MESLLVIKGWVLTHVPAFLGAGISLLVNKDKIKGMSNIEIYGIFFTGIILAHYIGGAIIEYYKIDPYSLTSDAITVTISAIGWSLLTVLISQLPAMFEAIRKKWFGA